VSLDFRCGYGAVKSNDVLQVRTSEYLEPMATTSAYFVSYPAIRNVLGAWADDHDCYYYSTNDAENYGQQYWQVTSKDGRSGDPIRYGDRIYLSSNCADYIGQRLTTDGDYLTTAKGADEWWSIEPDTNFLRNSNGVFQFSDSVRLRHMSGEYISRHDRSWPMLAQAGSVALRLSGGTGDVTDGVTVRIDSTESDLAGKTELGAFADSHDCYYSTPGCDANKQGWRLTKVDGGDAPVRYGDKVYITNLSYAGQKLAKDTSYAGYVTTSAASNDWWILEKT
jgi:hypothetical protein